MDEKTKNTLGLGLLHKRSPALYLSGLVAVLAAVVMVGWFIESSPLTQINSRFAPMQFNTALCFLLLALGIISGKLALILKKKHLLTLGTSISIICLLIGSASLLEYFFNTSFGIDTLFVDPFTQMKTSHAGRMAPNTALGFICSSIALLALLHVKSTWAVSCFGALSLVSFGLGFSALLGYAFDLEAIFGWADLTRMAAHTALAHSLLSFSIIYLLIRRMGLIGRYFKFWQASFVFVAGISVSLVFWYFAYSTELQSERRILNREADLRATVIQDDIETNIEVLSSIERLFAASNNVDAGEFSTFVKPFLEKNKSLLAIDWSPQVERAARLKWQEELYKNKGQNIKELDEDRRLVQRRGADVLYPVLFTEPNNFDPPAFGFDHYSDALRTVAMDEAARTGKPVATKLFKLFRAPATKSPEDFLVVIPVYEKRRSDAEISSAESKDIQGFIIGAFRFSWLLDSILESDANVGFQVRFADNEELLRNTAPIESTLQGEEFHPDYTFKRPLKLAGREYFVAFAPTYSFASRFSSELPLAGLVGSISTTILCTLLFLYVREHEEEIRERELRLRLAINGSELGTWDWDIPSGAVKVNSHWANMLGYRLEEIDQRFSSWESLLHPEDNERVTPILEKHLRGESPQYQVEFRLRAKDGSWIWVLSAGRVTNRDHQGNPLRATGVYLDINNVKQAKLELQRSERRLNALIEHAPAAVAMFDTEMNYITYTEQWLKDYNLEGQELRGRSYYEVFLEMSGDWKAIHQRCLQGEVIACEEEEFKRHDGTSIWLKWEFRPWYNEQDEIAGLTMFTEDLTKRKQLLHEVEKARDLAYEATRMKSEFLANMSHEIRTPLTSIVGYSEMLLDEKLSPSEQLNAKHTVLRNSRHLIQIVNEILDLSKIEAGKLDIECIDCNPVQVLHDISQLIQPRAIDKDISFSLEPRFPLPVRIQSDPLRLKQILINLAGNAVKFTMNGGVKIVVSFNQEAQQLKFSVVDTGVGMNEETRSKLFQAFSQADTSTTREFGGTGLGLVIANQLAERLGTPISVDSDEGRGSAFSFHINTGEVAASELIYDESAMVTEITEVEAPIVADDLSLTGQVLLVDDGLDNQVLISTLLKRSGLQVDVVENGVQAIVKAFEKPFDLILMDMQMPVMDGYQATMKLREKGLTIPIVALTANTMKEHIQKSLDAGCNEYLGKPFKKSELLSLVERYVDADELDKGATAENELKVLPEIDSGDEEIMQLAARYLNNLPNRIAAIEEALQEKDWARLGSLAHKFRGSCTLFPAFVPPSFSLEGAAIEESIANATEAVRQLQSLFDNAERNRKNWDSSIAEPASA